MAIEYLWHDHPLQLRSILSDAEARCFVCLQPISGYNYRCPKCNFFLHLSCLKVPLESLHPLHQHHPLTLLCEPPHSDDDDGHKVVCNECKNPCSGFTYHCAACPFTLHLQCASKQRTSKLDIHKHPLTFLVSPLNGNSSFRCNVCGDLGYGFNLYCKGCHKFVVHVECSELPVTVKRERDEHPFILIPTRSVDDEPEEVYCDVCEETVNPDGCVYYCAERSYIAHLGCLTSASKPHIKLSYKDVDLSSVETSDEPKLGTHQTDPFELQSDQIDDGELTKLRLHYSKQHLGDKAQTSQACDESEVQSYEGEDTQLTKPIHPNAVHSAVELQHFSHQHPLTLNDEHKKDKASCFACWGRISGLTYSCTQCNFFLHRWCAELPQEIQHPIHPAHSLTLLSRAPPNTYGCNACDETCDGFTYNCKPCYFNLHAMCASIPSTLRNEIHQHPLALCRKTPYSTRCKACGNDCTGTVFQCEMCKLELDFKCALLPYKVRHNCHIDPLILTSLPVEDDSDEFYCDACEERRDPNHWVYHCAEECEYSAHMNCVVSELLGGRPSPGPLQFDHHQHLLSLITKSPFNPS